MNTNSSQSETADNDKKVSGASFVSAKLVRSDYVSSVNFRFPEDQDMNLVIDEPASFAKAMVTDDVFTVSLFLDDEHYIPPVAFRLNADGTANLVELETGWQSESNYFRFNGSGNFYVKIILITADETEQGIIIVGTVPMPHEEN